MLEIGRAKLADAGDLHPLVEKYRAFYKQPANEKTLGYLKARLENDEAIVFIARDNAVAVGFTMLYPTFSTVSLSNVWLLNDFTLKRPIAGKVSPANLWKRQKVLRAKPAPQEYFCELQMTTPLRKVCMRVAVTSKMKYSADTT